MPDATALQRRLALAIPARSSRGGKRPRASSPPAPTRAPTAERADSAPPGPPRHWFRRLEESPSKMAKSKPRRPVLGPPGRTHFEAVRARAGEAYTLRACVRMFPSRLGWFALRKPCAWGLRGQTAVPSTAARSRGGRRYTLWGRARTRASRTHFRHDRWRPRLRATIHPRKWPSSDLHAWGRPVTRFEAASAGAASGVRACGRTDDYRAG